MFRRWLLAVSLAAVGACAVATQVPGSAVAASKPAPGWKTVSIPEYRMSLTIPANWQVAKEPGFLLTAFDPAGDPVVGTVLTIHAFGAEGYRFEELGGYAVSRFKKDVERLDPTAVTHVAQKRFVVGQTQVSYARLNVADHGTKLSAFSRTYGFSHARRGFIVGFQTLYRLAAGKTPLFDRIVGSVRFA